MGRWFYLLILWLTNALAIHITSQTYNNADVNIDSQTHFEIAIFTIDFDANVFINGTAISHLPLDPDPRMGGNGGTVMPLAMTLQMGATIMTCPCLGCSSPDFPDCTNTTCTWSSVMSGQNKGPPTSLIPVPALKDPLYVVFSIFAGKTGSEIDIVPVTNRVMLGKITKNFDSGQSKWIPYVPSKVDFTKCTLSFPISPNPVTLANGTAIGPLTTTNFTEQQRVCNYTEYVQKLSGLLDSINALDTASTQDDMNAAGWDVGSILARDVWIACSALAQSMLVYQTSNQTILGDAKCYYDNTDPRWLADPCCNTQLSWTQCCAPKQVTVEINSVIGFDSSQMNQACHHPPQSILVLSDYVINSQKAELCAQQTKDAGFGVDMWSSLTSFMQVCQQDIFGSGSGPPACKTDTDCWTSCNTNMQQCVVPYNNPTSYLIACFSEKMSPEMQRFLRKTWGLTAASTEQAFESSFLNHTSDMGCQGPSSWLYQGGWQATSVFNCSQSDNNCFCNLGGPNGTQQCIKNVYIMPNQTGCLADMKCNWDTSNAVTNVTCLAKTPNHFCGDCQGQQCWDQTRPSVCQTWIGPGENCSLLNMTSDQYNTGQCNVPFTNETDCVPDGLCPPSSVNSGFQQVYSRWCGATCYYPNALNSSTCANKTHAPIFTNWDISAKGGSGFCRVSYWNKQDCLSANATWFSGRYYADGILDTTTKCSAGECNMGSWFTQSQCTSLHFCNTPCKICVADDWSQGNLCFAKNVSSSNCTTNLGGQFVSGICEFQWLNNRNSCESAGHTFESCDDLTANLSLCSACQGGTNGCPITQNSILKCKVNNWGACPTQQQCQSTGICDDW